MSAIETRDAKRILWADEGRAFQFLSYVSEEMLVVIFILHIASYSRQEIVRRCNQTVEPFLLGTVCWDVHDEVTGCAGSAPERRHKRKKKSPCHFFGMVPNIAQRHDSVTQAFLGQESSPEVVCNTEFAANR